MAYYPLFSENCVPLMSSGSPEGSCSPPHAHWHSYPWEQVWITSCLKLLILERYQDVEILVQTCQGIVKLNPALQARPVFLRLTCSFVWDN